MTQKQIDKEFNHFKNLEYPLQYQCFIWFIKNNIRQASYFKALIEHYKNNKTT